MIHQRNESILFSPGGIGMLSPALLFIIHYLTPSSLVKSFPNTLLPPLTPLSPTIYLQRSKMKIMTNFISLIYSYFELP